MDHLEQILYVEEIDKKLSGFIHLSPSVIPRGGWINTIRTGLKMSIRQLAHRLRIKAPSLKQLEMREKKGAVTLKTLYDVAESLDMKFVYGFVPKNGSLRQMIEDRALKIANSIVLSAVGDSQKKVDVQSSKRFKKLVGDIAAELIKSIPRYFWSDDPDEWNKGFFGKGIKENMIKYLQN